MKNILFFDLFRKKVFLLFIFKFKSIFSQSGREEKYLFGINICEVEREETSSSDTKDRELLICTLSAAFNNVKLSFVLLRVGF